MDRRGTYRFDGAGGFHTAQKRGGVAAEFTREWVSLAAERGGEHRHGKSRKCETGRDDLFLSFSRAKGLEGYARKLQTRVGHNLEAGCWYFMILKDRMPHSLR